MAIFVRRRLKKDLCPRSLRSDRTGLDGFFDYGQSVAKAPETGHEDVDRRNRIVARVVIEMRRPEIGDRQIVLVGGLTRQRLIEILVFDPAARRRIEPQDLRAGGLGFSS